MQCQHTASTVGTVDCHEQQANNLVLTTLQENNFDNIMENNFEANAAKQFWQLRQNREPLLFIIAMSLKEVTRRCWLVLYLYM